MNKLAYTINEFCDVSGLKRNKVYTCIKAGQLVARKLDKRTVITADDAIDFLKSLPKAVLQH